MLRRLREAGFSVEMTHHGFHALNDHILGFTLQELSFASDDEALGALEKKFFRDFPGERFPYLTEHATAHRLPLEERDGVEFVLDLILDGLERVRTAT